MNVEVINKPTVKLLFDLIQCTDEEQKQNILEILSTRYSRPFDSEPNTLISYLLGSESPLREDQVNELSFILQATGRFSFKQ